MIGPAFEPSDLRQLVPHHDVLLQGGDDGLTHRDQGADLPAHS